MANLLRTLYAPLFFFGFIAPACWLSDRQGAPLWILIALLMLAIAISFITEWKLPF